MTWSFLIAFIVDCLALLIAFGFIIYDAIYSRSSKNGPLAVATLVMCAWVGISYFLHTHGNSKMGSSMAWLPAFPLLGYGLIILMMVIGKPDFK